ncbi:hypothetical protein KIN20_016328 [Parelaphostrongylus tenuis]|uniref:Uncharacterized protein n=1 Tax=Parelaphostrongylus tenuis TaxID=148309 RepID=A0AAD5MYE2_PARTN|nr:hypothetical protein KIN20_016328 [Parelaphostrongylus tenuis]
MESTTADEDGDLVVLSIAFKASWNGNLDHLVNFKSNGDYVINKSQNAFVTLGTSMGFMALSYGTPIWLGTG